MVRSTVLCLLLFGLLQGQEAKEYTPQQGFRKIVGSAMISQLFFMPYTYIYGVTLSADEVQSGNSLGKANIMWGVTSMAGMGIAWFSVHDAINSTLKQIPTGKVGNRNLNLYQIFTTGYPVASIIDFKAESKVRVGGAPAWYATIPEVNMAVSLPSFSYRLGMGGKRLAIEMETGLVSHHTIAQNVFYDAVGIPIGSVSLPERFLMLHSMAMGFNIMVMLPKLGVQPYLGYGVKALLNSSQSEYEGPTDVTPSNNSLALDRTSLGWGQHVFLGLRKNLPHDKFIMIEFKPSRYYFKYETGEYPYEEIDNYTLQSFDFLIGIGKMLF